MFSLFNFSSIFQGSQLTPFAPVCGRPCFKPSVRRGQRNEICHISETVAYKTWHSQFLQQMMNMQSYTYIMIQQTGLMTTTLSDHNQPKPLRFYAGHDL